MSLLHCHPCGVSLHVLLLLCPSLSAECSEDGDGNDVESQDKDCANVRLAVTYANATSFDCMCVPPQFALLTLAGPSQPNNVLINNQPKK